MDNGSALKLVITEFNDSSKPGLERLLKRAVISPAFYNLAFLEAYAATSHHKIVLAQLVDSNGLVLAILPGKEKSGNRFENITFRGWDHLDVISAGSDYSQLLIALICKKYRVLSLMSFQEDARYENSPNKAFTTEGFKCPYLELPTEFELLLNSLSSSFKKTVRRKLNKFYKDGGEIKVVDSNASEAEQMQSFEELWDLHSRRAEDSGKTSRFTNEDIKSFHKSLSSHASGNQGVTVLFFKAKMNGRVIGVYYCFKTSNTIYYFNSGIDPDFSLYSPGMVLMAASIEWAIKESVTTFDFLRGTEAYKFHWTDKVKPNKNYYFASTPFPRLRAFPAYFKDQRNRIGAKKVILEMLRSDSKPALKSSNV
jgi:CelD/BcsL family acetyltransferase involved in cellulose biosynthesis